MSHGTTSAAGSQRHPDLYNPAGFPDLVHLIFHFRDTRELYDVQLELLTGLRAKKRKFELLRHRATTLA